MFWIAWLALTIVAAAGGLVAHLAGASLPLKDLLVIYLVCLVACELGLIAIALLKGDDQASATQAGLSGLMVLMFVSFGGILAMRLAGLISQGASLMSWSPLLFFISLALVAASAIRTIRRAPLAGSKSASTPPSSQSHGAQS